MTKSETVADSIRKLRTKTLPEKLGVRISQPRFARLVSEVATNLYGVYTPCSARAIQDWEYGKHDPNSACVGAIIQMIHSCNKGELTKLPKAVYYDRDFYSHLDTMVSELSGKVVEKS